MQYAGRVGFGEDRLRYSSANCSIARTMELVGDRWTMHVLREAFFGLRRFEELLAAVGCGRAMLSQRLHALVEHGLLERVQYRQPGQRRRHEYGLTAKGREVFPVLVALMDWGDRWTADPEGPAVEIRHDGCGERVHVHLACDGGHTALTTADVHAEQGSGAMLVA